MKKVLILLFTLCLLLSACGKAPAEPPATEQPSNGDSLEAAAEGQATNFDEMDYDQMMEKFYTTLGCFQIKKTDYEQFVRLPPKEAFSFAVHLRNWEDPEFMQEYLAFNAECAAISDKMKEIETACLAGQPPEGYTYGTDISAWEHTNPNVEKSALPLEYFQLAEQLQQIGSQITPELQTQREEERNQLKLELARLLAEQGFKTEVWATKTVEDYEEKQYYICFLTATPAQLWELETLTDISPVFIEPQYESVRLRFDIPIWTSEET